MPKGKIHKLTLNDVMLDAQRTLDETQRLCVRSREILQSVQDGHLVDALRRQAECYRTAVPPE